MHWLRRYRNEVMRAMYQEHTASHNENTDASPE